VLGHSRRTVTETVLLSGHSLTRGQMVAAGWEQLVTAVQLAAVTMTGSWVMCRIQVKFRCDSCARHRKWPVRACCQHKNPNEGSAALSAASARHILLQLGRTLSGCYLTASCQRCQSAQLLLC